MAEIRMPKMGDGMEEGTINSWFKKEGDQIKEGEAIAEVETDKANVEIASYETGTLTKIIVQPGQTVPVGEIIAIIGSLNAAAGGNGAATATQSVPSTGAQNGAGGTGASRPGDDSAIPAAIPTHAQGADTPAASAEGVGPSSERVKASPLARRMAVEMNLDLARIKGTGPGGRIVERDIHRLRAKRRCKRIARSENGRCADFDPWPLARTQPHAPARAQHADRNEYQAEQYAKGDRKSYCPE